MGYGVTYSSPNESPDQGEEERSQMIGWNQRAEVGAPSGQVKRVPRLREKKDGNILDKKEKKLYFQARLQK